MVFIPADNEDKVWVTQLGEFKLDSIGETVEAGQIMFCWTPQHSLVVSGQNVSDLHVVGKVAYHIHSAVFRWLFISHYERFPVEQKIIGRLKIFPVKIIMIQKFVSLYDQTKPEPWLLLLNYSDNCLRG